MAKNDDLANFDFVERSEDEQAELEHELIDDDAQFEGAPSDPARRSFTGALLGFGGAAALGFTVIAKEKFARPRTGADDTWVRAAGLDDLPKPGAAPKRVMLRYPTRDEWRISEHETAVYLIYKERSEENKDDKDEAGKLKPNVEAMSAVCTHAGCFVDYDRKAKHFACPCHKATFDAQGVVLTGPPPRDLDGMKIEQREDGLYVQIGGEPIKRSNQPASE